MMWNPVMFFKIRNVQTSDIFFLKDLMWNLLMFSQHSVAKKEEKIQCNLEGQHGFK